MSNSGANFEAISGAGEKLAKLPVHSSITSNTTLTAGEFSPVNATSAPITVLLPTGKPFGTLIAVEKEDGTENVVTVSGSIRGEAATDSLKLKRETVIYQAESSGSWRPLADHKTLSSLDARYEVVCPPPTENAAIDTLNVKKTLEVSGITSHGSAIFNKPGVYYINEELIRPHTSSVIIGPTTVFLATSSMTNLLSDPITGKTEYRSIVGGGRLSSNNLAKHALWCRHFEHLTLGVQCENSLEDDVILGDNVTPASGVSIEPILTEAFWVNRYSGSVPTGHSSLWAQWATDGRMFGNVIKGQETGIRIGPESGGWIGIGVHPYGADYPMQVCIDDHSQNQWTNPVLDTPTPKVHTLATGSGANSTITDTEILSNHEGRPVSGTHIPAESFVGTVTPNTSFLLVNALGEEVKPIGAVSGVTLAGVGVMCRAPWFKVIGGIIYISPGYGTDNAAYGIVCTPSMSTGGELRGFIGRGGSNLFRVTKIIAGKTSTVEWSGLTEINCVTPLTSLIQPAVEGTNPTTSSISRNGSGQITGAVFGTGSMTQTIASVARNSAGLVTSFEQNGVTHTVTRNPSGQVTAVS